MSDDLFFLSIIARALGQEDVESALRDAFDQIQTLGRQQRYQAGYRQFTRFMQEAGEAAPQEAAKLLLGQFCQQFERPEVLDIVVEQGDNLLATCSFSSVSGKQTIDGVTPGPYRVRLDTGRVLWDGLLTEEDLLWAKAFPGVPLKMAADTGEDKTQPTKTIPLLHGCLVLRVLPGIERGVLEVELTQP